MQPPRYPSYGDNHDLTEDKNQPLLQSVAFLVCHPEGAHLTGLGGPEPRTR